MQYDKSKLRYEYDAQNEIRRQVTGTDAGKSFQREERKDVKDLKESADSQELFEEMRSVTSSLPSR
jgi:hypothetical protein